jgi:hypothetical protein
MVSYLLSRLSVLEIDLTASPVGVAPGQSREQQDRYTESVQQVASSRPKALATVQGTGHPPSPSSEDSA